MLRVQELAIDALQDRIRKAHQFACDAQGILDADGNRDVANNLICKSIIEIVEASVWAVALQKDNKILRDN